MNEKQNAPFLTQRCRLLALLYEYHCMGLRMPYEVRKSFNKAYDKKVISEAERRGFVVRDWGWTYITTLGIVELSRYIDLDL
jgi:hypothetical protein